MAFFNLSRKLQVVLIASGLAVAPQSGCRTPQGEPPENAPGDSGKAGECSSLDIDDMEVSVTKASSNRSTLEIDLQGSFPDEAKIEFDTFGHGIEVIESGLKKGPVLVVEVGHGTLSAGDVGTLSVSVTAKCKGRSITFTQSISICKQAGGLKILEQVGTCEVPPPPPPPPQPPPKDASTSPDMIMIVDPVPYPYDPIPDPPPPPPPNYDDPVPQPMIYDCVPDSMKGAPGNSASASGAIGNPGLVRDANLLPRIVHSPADDGSWLLCIENRWGGSCGDVSVEWSCSAGSLSSATGTSVRWTHPGDGGMHAVMAVVQKDGAMEIETWRSRA